MPDQKKSINYYYFGLICCLQTGASHVFLRDTSFGYEMLVTSNSQITLNFFSFLPKQTALGQDVASLLFLSHFLSHLHIPRAASLIFNVVVIAAYRVATVAARFCLLYNFPSCYPKSSVSSLRLGYHTRH